jgi:hypothetical protein
MPGVTVVTRYAPQNHVSSGVRVACMIVPAVTDVRSRTGDTAERWDDSRNGTGRPPPRTRGKRNRRATGPAPSTCRTRTRPETSAGTPADLPGRPSPPPTTTRRALGCQPDKHGRRYWPPNAKAGYGPPSLLAANARAPCVRDERNSVSEDRRAQGSPSCKRLPTSTAGAWSSTGSPRTRAPRQSPRS